MYPEKLKKEEHYLYKCSDVFGRNSGIVKCFIEYDYSKGMHVQEFFEINIVMRGKGMHYIENSKTEADRGDVFVIPPNISHGYSGGVGFDVCHVLISNEFMEKYITDLQILPCFYILFSAEPMLRSTANTPFYLSLKDEEFKKTESFIDALKAHTKTGITSLEYVMSNSLTVMLIAQLCDCYSKKSHGESTPEADTAFLNALAMIHSHYNEKLSIEKLARIAHLSRSAFLRKFNDTCKTTPGKYLNSVRINAAEHILGNTSLSIEETAIRTGFYDASHFSRAFLLQTGMTPNAYRKHSGNK